MASKWLSFLEQLRRTLFLASDSSENKRIRNRIEARRSMKGMNINSPTRQSISCVYELSPGASRSLTARKPIDTCRHCHVANQINNHYHSPTSLSATQSNRLLCFSSFDEVSLGHVWDEDNLTRLFFFGTASYSDKFPTRRLPYEGDVVILVSRSSRSNLFPRVGEVNEGILGSEFEACEEGECLSNGLNRGGVYAEHNSWVIMSCDRCYPVALRPVWALNLPKCLTVYRRWFVITTDLASGNFSPPLSAWVKSQMCLYANTAGRLFHRLS